LFNYKYLYYCRNDGIGFQYTCISKLLNVAISENATLLVDWRNLSFFKLRRQEFSVDRLHEFFLIKHAHIVYDPHEIDRILLDHPDEVLGIDMGKHHNPHPQAASHIRFANFHELGLEFDNKCEWLGPYISLRGECFEKFLNHRPIAKRCIGIHARLGNGEMLNNPLMRQRMDIPVERFFEEIDKHDDTQILVCTDSPAFLSACMDRYGNQVVAVPRSMPDENEGPGHAAGKKPRNIELDGYELLGDSLVELLLLGECRFLICNASLFTVHARKFRQVPHIVLTNGGADYGLLV